MNMQTKVKIGIVVGIMAMVSACDPVNTNQIRRSVKDAQPVIADTVVEQINKVWTYQDAIVDFVSQSPGTGCVTYDIFEKLSGKDTVDQLTMCK